MLTINRSKLALVAAAMAWMLSACPAAAQAHSAAPAATQPSAPAPGALAGVGVQPIDSHDTAHAASVPHDDHSHEKASVIQKPPQAIGPAIVTLVVFGLCFAVLATKVWPKILGGLKDRENKIRDEIESAEMARKQAGEALESYQKSLADARVEAAREIASARAQAQAISADLRAKAEIELTAMRERAMKDIENAKRAAVSEIYATATNTASVMAGKILRRQINVGDQAQLVEETMGQLQGMGN